MKNHRRTLVKLLAGVSLLTPMIGCASLANGFSELQQRVYGDIGIQRRPLPGHQYDPATFRSAPTNDWWDETKIRPKKEKRREESQYHETVTE